MIHDFQLWWNTEVVFGDGAAEKLGALIKRDGATKVMVHYGSGEYLHSTGVLDTVRKSLEDAGLEYIELGGVVPNPRISLVREGIELARREGVDYMVAIGGGSAIDSAKCIAVGVFYDGDIWDVCSRDVSLAGKMKTLPVASVVTMPATGSERYWVARKQSSVCCRLIPCIGEREKSRNSLVRVGAATIQNSATAIKIPTAIRESSSDLSLFHMN